MVKSHPQMGISELWEAMQMGSQTVSIRLRRKGETTRWRWLNMHSIASVFWKAKRDFIRSSHHWVSRLLLNRLLSRWLTNTEKMKCWSSNDIHCHHPLDVHFHDIHITTSDSHQAKLILFLEATNWEMSRALEASFILDLLRFLCLKISIQLTTEYFIPQTQHTWFTQIL